MIIINPQPTTGTYSNPPIRTISFGGKNYDIARMSLESVVIIIQAQKQEYDRNETGSAGNSPISCKFFPDTGKYPCDKKIQSRHYGSPCKRDMEELCKERGRQSRETSGPA